MQRIVTHIKRLLLTNDCVIIPEFGGFVLHPCQAEYFASEHKFCPPGKGIVFNTTINHHDRLLLDSYMQMYGLTFEEARIMLKKDTKKLYNTIDNEGFVCFEKIGLIKRGEDWNLCFEQEQHATFMGLRPYGLHTFYLPPVSRAAENRTNNTTIHAVSIPLSRTKKDIPADTKNIVYLPVNRKFIRAVSISAAVVALFFIVSMPVNKVGQSCFSAGLIPSEIWTTNAHISEIQEDTILSTVVNEEVEKTVTPTAQDYVYRRRASIEEIEKTVTPTSDETASPMVVSQPSPVVALPPRVASQSPRVVKSEEVTQRFFYAIIASFASEQHANQHIQQINMPELQHIGIVVSDGRARVYAGKFDTRDEAQNFIISLRANEKLKNTWLYVGE